jgi:DNA-binding transcriptional ArsR family regulator
VPLLLCYLPLLSCKGGFFAVLFPLFLFLAMPDLALPPDSLPAAPALPLPLAAAPDAVVLLDPLTVLGAVSDGSRYLLLRELSKGDPVSVNELAGRLKRSADLISKHLRVLREARLIMAVAAPDGDGRKQFHHVPAPFRSRDAAGAVVLDFGSVMLRF